MEQPSITWRLLEGSGLPPEILERVYGPPAEPDDSYEAFLLEQATHMSGDHWQTTFQIYQHLRRGVDSLIWAEGHVPDPDALKELIVAATNERIELVLAIDRHPANVQKYYESEGPRPNETTMLGLESLSSVRETIQQARRRALQERRDPDQPS